MIIWRGLRGRLSWYKQAKDQEKADSKKRGLEKRLKKSTGPSRSTRYEPATDLFNLNDDDPPQDEETTSSPAPETVTVPDDSPIKLMPVTALSSTYRITPATSRLLLPDALFLLRGPSKISHPRIHSTDISTIKASS